MQKRVRCYMQRTRFVVLTHSLIIHLGVPGTSAAGPNGRLSCAWLGASDTEEERHQRALAALLGSTITAGRLKRMGLLTRQLS